MRYIAWLVANTLWFGFFADGILHHGWSLWCIAIPIILHWKITDIR